MRSTLTIPDHELAFTTSRSGGPGGQHVNKVETRVTVVFDVLHSPSLTDDQRARIVERLARRIDSRGRIRLSSDLHRSQSRNRDEVRARLHALLARALTPETPRVATRVPAAAKRRRLDDKRRRGEVKRGRGGTDD